MFSLLRKKFAHLFKSKQSAPKKEPPTMLGSWVSKPYDQQQEQELEQELEQQEEPYLQQ